MLVANFLIEINMHLHNHLTQPFATLLILYHACVYFAKNQLEHAQFNVGTTITVTINTGVGDRRIGKVFGTYQVIFSWIRTRVKLIVAGRVA